MFNLYVGIALLKQGFSKYDSHIKGDSKLWNKDLIKNIISDKRSQ